MREAWKSHAPSGCDCHVQVAPFSQLWTWFEGVGGTTAPVHVVGIYYLSWCSAPILFSFATSPTLLEQGWTRRKLCRGRPTLVRGVGQDGYSSVPSDLELEGSGAAGNHIVGFRVRRDGDTLFLGSSGRLLCDT